MGEPFKITRIPIKMGRERRLVAALIASDDLLKIVAPALKVQYFHTPIIQQVMAWVLEFYGEYGKAPKFHIQDIFDRERQKLTDTEVIAEFLSNLSNE